MRGWFTYVLDIGMDIADRAKTDAEFEEVWNHFGVVVRYLTTHRPGGVGDAARQAAIAAITAALGENDE